MIIREIYGPEELIPLVAELARKYTGGESTSITYELAGQLMEAVLYCMEEYEKDQEDSSLPAAGEKLSADFVYREGYELVVRKTKKMRKFYSSMIGNFQSYGNRNYEDTVRRGLPEFFRRYDARFKPQDHLLTLDYPVLKPLGDLCGIDRIEEYLSCVRLEQRFLGAFAQPYVERVLSAWNWNYREQFDNLCGILLRNVLGCILSEKPLEMSPEPEHYDRLAAFVRGHSREALSGQLEALLRRLIESRWNGNELLYAYLCPAIQELAVTLKESPENTLRNGYVIPF